MVEIILKAVIGSMLLLCTVQDVQKKKVSTWIILLGAVAIGICIPFCSSIGILDRLGGFIIGVLVIMISLVSHGKIGLGDGALLCVTGLGLGFWGNLELFGFALLFAGGLSVILLTFRLANRKKSIPFVPFMLLGFVILLFADR